MDLFEKASRTKVRFVTDKGVLSVEDLWILPLTSKGSSNANLDSIAVELDTTLKNTTTKSFVKKEKSINEELQLKFDIVKHIIDVRMAEADELSKERVKKETKEKLLSIIARKEDQNLESMSLEDLKRMANDA